MWTRRGVLKTFAASGALAMSPALRTAFGAQKPDVALRLVAAPATMAMRAGALVGALSRSSRRSPSTTTCRARRSRR